MPGPGPYGNKISWQDKANKRWGRWSRNNPNATPAEKKRAKVRIGRAVRGTRVMGRPSYPKSVGRPKRMGG